MNKLVIPLATFVGVGKAPKAPGTWGSLVGAGLYYLFPSADLFLLLFSFFVGWWASNKYEEISGKHDASEIIIDEVAGQVLTLMIMSAFVGFGLFGCLVGFAMFRVFDILKPWPISWFDKNVKGGLGVMLDDIVAAIPAGLLSVLILSFLGNI